MDKYYDSAMHFHESNRKFDPIIFIQFAVNRSLVCEKLKFNRSSGCYVGTLANLHLTMGRFLTRFLLILLILAASISTANCSLTIEQKMENIEQSYVSIFSSN